MALSDSETEESFEPARGFLVITSAAESDPEPDPDADLDLDPEIIHDTSISGTWRVRVSNPGTFDSKLDWYVLHVTVSDGPDDE